MKHLTSISAAYIVLGIVTTLLLLNIHQITTFHFNSVTLLRSLHQWEAKQEVLLKLDSIVNLRKQTEQLLSNFNELVDEEKYLLEKVKESFIEDNRELQDIPQIYSFHKKLTTYQKIQTKENQEFKAISQHIHKIKNMQTHKGNVNLTAFRNIANEVINNLTLLRSELKIVLQKNKQWNDQSKTQFAKKSKISPQIYSDQDIEDLPEYYSMVPLARQVLRPLPLDFLKILYKSISQAHEEPEIQVRQKYYKERVYLARQHPQLPAFSLSKYNIRSAIQVQSWGNDILSDYARLNAKYSFDNYNTQKGICILVPTYNNANNFRVELNLNSIFSQNYTNYKVVIIDDFSTDATPLIIEQYLNYYNISKQKCELILNKINKKALSNIYNAIINNCQQQQIITIVDGDDELVGYNVLKVLNAVYSKQLYGVVYSNFYFFKHKILYVKEGFSSEYNSSEQQDFRASKQRFSHLISFKAELFRQIKIQDLQQNGQFYSVAYDYAMLYPLMELSCKRVKYIQQFQYLYSIGTGMNDFQIFKDNQRDVGERILKKPPYKCSKKYQD